MTYLTQSEGELWSAVVEALEGEGFPFNPLTTDIAQYLETCLGQSNASETKSVAHMLADLNGSYGGSLSHLTSSVAHLLDDLAANIGAGGGGGVARALTLNGKTLMLNGKTLTLGTT